MPVIHRTGWQLFHWLLLSLEGIVLHEMLCSSVCLLATHRPQQGMHQGNFGDYPRLVLLSPLQAGDSSSSASQSQAAAQQAPSSASQQAQGAQEGRRSSQGWALPHAPAGRVRLNIALLSKKAFRDFLDSIVVDKVVAVPLWAVHTDGGNAAHQIDCKQTEAYLAAILACQVDGAATVRHCRGL